MIDSTREQKRAELEQKIKAMRLMDDNFMTAVLSDKACAELVIRIILDRDDIIVKHTRTQYTINSLKNHSVRLDVYAEDLEGTKYDIEIQRSDRGATPKRARYISSMIDAAFKRGLRRAAGNLCYLHNGERHTKAKQAAVRHRQNHQRNAG